MTLWAITTYFNPCRYKTRRVNYDKFVAALKHQKVPLLTVECAFGDDEFELDESLSVVHVRSESVLWQKERLLNLAASWLPPSCTEVVWLDGDIIFTDHDWAKQARRLFEQKLVIQPWTTCHRLNRWGSVSGASEDVSKSFAAVTTKDISTMSVQRYDTHGHTGYAWGMHRYLFDKFGLYEHAVSGSSDHFMAHAVYGDLGFCVQNALKHDAAQISHLREWVREFYAEVDGSIGALRGTIHHLWHGDPKNRRYFLRMHEITDLGFNPYTDLLSPHGRPLEWADGVRERKPGLVAYFQNYFQSRKEDGEE